MIQEIIDKHLAEKQEKRKDREGANKWKPSSFGKCFRQQFWNKTDEPYSNPPDQRLLRVFAVGHLFHDFVEGFIPNKQTEVLVETPHIKGFADIVLDDCVWDIKSQHSNAFWYMEKENTIPITERKRPDFLQVAWYALNLKKPKCGVAYVSKDDLCLREYCLPVDNISEHLNTELAYLKRIEESNTLPAGVPRAYPSYSKGKLAKYKECDYCSYKDKCFELDGKKDGKVQ